MNLIPPEPYRPKEDEAWKWTAAYVAANRLLLERMKDFEIPEPTWAPAQDIAIVYRIPNTYKGSLILPEAYDTRHDAPFSLGVLLMAGPEATDVLESHGIMPGDIVRFARFAGEEEAVNRAHEAMSQASNPEVALAAAKRVREEEMAKKKILSLQVPFIHGSVDLFERLYGPKPTMRLVRHVLPSGKVEHLIRPV